jgi:hypothetical protein
MDRHRRVSKGGPFRHRPSPPWAVWSCGPERWVEHRRRDRSHHRTDPSTGGEKGSPPVGQLISTPVLLGPTSGSRIRQPGARRFSLSSSLRAPRVALASGRLDRLAASPSAGFMRRPDSRKWGRPGGDMPLGDRSHEASSLAAAILSPTGPHRTHPKGTRCRGPRHPQAGGSSPACGGPSATPRFWATAGAAGLSRCPHAPDKRSYARGTRLDLLPGGRSGAQNTDSTASTGTPL